MPHVDEPMAASPWTAVADPRMDGNLEQQAPFKAQPDSSLAIYDLFCHGFMYRSVFFLKTILSRFAYVVVSSMFAN